MGEVCTIFGGKERLCRVLMVKPEGKRPFGRPRHKWEDNVKMET